MSDDEFDITKSLALFNAAELDSDLDLDSGSGFACFGATEEPQDIISDLEDDSDDDAAKAPAKRKKQENGKMEFPKLEADADDDDDAGEMAAYFTTNSALAKKAKAGTFSSFGLLNTILKNIAKKGYRQPTPIQRKTIPLIMENRDVVGMARTGSGKTAAFVLPMIEKLKAHSAKVGVRAVIMSPLRELALQTYKQVREFSKGTDLRLIVLIGGDSLEDQFLAMMLNPDIVVATPGRFLHLKVEMELSLSTVEYIVFDEADRLFEMGFAEQLNELLAVLPSLRQLLLFSATLPKSLVDFAKAGLTNPVLVRLDAETKVLDQLQMAFFTTKRNEREATLLHVLQSVIKMPVATEEQKKKLHAIENRQNLDDEEAEQEEEENRKLLKKRPRFKRERLPPANQLPLPQSTIIFVPTKHHVEYVTMLLRDAGYLVLYIYGTLDQRARKNQLYQFRIGATTIMVVTDVAARGIDIPVLANVINYTLPLSLKIFVHRVGRTARAGNAGWAYLIVLEKELPYMLDLELFLGKKVLLTAMHEKKKELLKQRQGDAYVEPKVLYTQRMVMGLPPRLELEGCQEFYDTLLANHYEMKVIRDVSVKAEKLYYRTRQPALTDSVKRAKELVDTGVWDEQHLLFGANPEKEKQAFLEKLTQRNLKETVFEFLKKGDQRDENLMAAFMQKRRRQLAPIQRKAQEKRELMEKERLAGLSRGIEEEIFDEKDEVGYSVRKDATVDDDELLAAFEQEPLTSKRFRDPTFFMSHYAPALLIQDQQLQLGNTFALDAAGATFDLADDDGPKHLKQIMKWDPKKKNYVNQKLTDKKYIIGELGQRIPASFRSGKFDTWRKQRNVAQLTPGQLESDVKLGNFKPKHNQTKAPKLPDKFRDDYHKQKKKVEKAVELGRLVKGYNRPGQRLELQSTEQIRKARQLKEKRKAKNARPAKKKKY